MIVIMALSMTALSHAETTGIILSGDESCIHIENISDVVVSHTLDEILVNKALSAFDEMGNGWHYYIVHSGKTKQKLLDAFLLPMRRLHRHSKLPFSAVADYWKTQFDVPIQVYVFADKDGQTDAFSGSRQCEMIVSIAHALGLGFLWNGAAQISEPKIKQILNVPDEWSLVASIFLYQPQDQRFSQVSP